MTAKLSFLLPSLAALELSSPKTAAASIVATSLDLASNSRLLAAQLTAPRSPKKLAVELWQCHLMVKKMLTSQLFGEIWWLWAVTVRTCLTRWSFRSALNMGYLLLPRAYKYRCAIPTVELMRGSAFLHSHNLIHTPSYISPATSPWTSTFVTMKPEASKVGAFLQKTSISVLYRSRHAEAFLHHTAPLSADTSLCLHMPHANLSSFSDKAPAVKEGVINPSRVLCSQGSGGAGAYRNTFRHITKKPKNIFNVSNFLEDF